MSSEQWTDMQTDQTQANSYEQFEDELFDSEIIPSDSEDENDDDLLDILRIAVRKQDVTLVREVLQEKPNLQTTKGGLILWDAVFKDNMEIASLLIRSGANVNVKKPNDIFESSLLYELGSSRKSKHHELALLTMEYGGQASDFETEYILCHAIYNESLKIVEALLRRGTPVRCSIVHQMARSPRAVEFIRLLIGGDYVAVDAKYRRAVSAFYQLYVLSGDESRIIPVVETLLSLGLDVNVANTYGDVLLYAIRCKRSKTVQLLIEHGIDVNQPSRDGILPLHSAAITNQPVIVELLLESGALINARSGSDLRPQTSHFGQCALHAACKGQPKPEILSILLSRGANVSVVDVFRRTPFSYARFSRHLTEAHRLFIKHFAILESKGVEIHEFDRKIIEKNAEMRSFEDECKMDLKSMRSIWISRETTFYSVLIRNVRILSFYMRSRRFRDKCSECQVERLFPCYADDLKLKLMNAEKRRVVMVDREELVCEVLEPIVPYPVLENVILHLYLDATNDK